MNRQEFLRQLESLLYAIPANERADALTYYNDYFDEAGIENEQNVIQELGSPQKVAQSIIEDFRSSGYEQTYENTTGQYSENSYQNQNTYRNEKKKKLKTWQIVLLIILAVVGFPVWIGLAAGLFGTVIGLLGSLFGILVGLAGTAFGLIIGGLGVAIIGVLGVIANPLEGVTAIGVGLILAAIGILLALLFVLITFAWLPKLVKAIIGWIKGLFHRNEGGNEI